MVRSNKKYYNIGEMSEILNVSQAALRYFEKTSSNIKIYKVSGRRYYTSGDLEIFRSHFEKEPKLDYKTILMKIDYLERQFVKLLGIANPSSHQGQFYLGFN